MALIVAFLWLPKPWTLALFQPNSVIEIELIASQHSLPDPKVTTDPKPIIQPQPEPDIEQPVNAPIESPNQSETRVTEATAKPMTQTETAAKSPQPITSEATTTVQFNATDVLQMIQDRTAIEITPEFQARTQPASDFYIPEHEIQDWLADIPYLDESVDKPKLQMKFYAQGFTGGIEKFFDKITISKTFTTKYGTKIHCALIGIIVACGWK